MIATEVRRKRLQVREKGRWRIIEPDDLDKWERSQVNYHHRETVVNEEFKSLESGKTYRWIPPAPYKPDLRFTEES
jgi:hypothetical protein